MHGCSSLCFCPSGYEEVMFIHTHYSRLSEIVSGAAQEPPLNHQEKVKRFAVVSTPLFFSK